MLRRATPSLVKATFITTGVFSIQFLISRATRTKDVSESSLKNIITLYSSTVTLTGHITWSATTPTLISDYDVTTATMVHVSSTGAPRTTSFTHPTKKSNPGIMSEGIYVQAYKDFIITNGCDFVNGQFLAYAIYKIDNR